MFRVGLNQVGLLRQSAIKGNREAVKSLLIWAQVDPQAPGQVTDRQVFALQALASLVKEDKSGKFSNLIALHDAKELCTPYLNCGDEDAHAAADAIIGSLPAEEDMAGATRDLPGEGEAEVEQDEVELDDQSIEWAAEKGYDLEEIYDFKESWVLLDRIGNGLQLHDFVSFVIAQFGGIDETLLSQLQRMDLEGQYFTFMDFLKYMDQYESYSDNEMDYEEGDDYESPSGSEEDSFYLGGPDDEPHKTLRQFVQDGANLSQLMASMQPTDADYAAVFKEDVAAKVKARCQAVWQEGLLDTIRPVHTYQKYVGVYVIEDEYRELWRQVSPLVNPGVVAYGFDFNTEQRFSSRGSATYAFVVEVGGNWRFFPAQWITMSDPEFTRRMNPLIKEVKQIADRVLANDRITEIGAELRPSEEDWKALFASLDLAQRAHELYEKSVTPPTTTSANEPKRAWNIGPVVAHHFGGVSQYFRYDVLAAEIDDWESNTKLSRRLTAKFPATYRRLVPHIKPKTLLCGIRLKNGLMDAPDPHRQVLPQYRTDQYLFREGDFAPAKTFTVLAKVNGKWKYFPKKVIFHALNVNPMAEDSTSECDFYDSTDISGSESDYSEEDFEDQGAALPDESGRGRVQQPPPAGSWSDYCVVQ